MSKKDKHKVIKFSKRRQLVSDALHQSLRYKHIIALLEVDVTKALEIMDKHRKETGVQLSFTSWSMKCIAQAVSEFPDLISFRKGRKKIIQFEDVDIKCNVEKVVDGVKHPIAYIVRKANEKSFKEIHDEIRSAQGRDVDQRAGEEQVKKKQLNIMNFPRFIRRIIWNAVMSNPFAVKKNIGTIGVTALGMFGKGISGWAIPKTMHATTFALGAIVKKPVYVGDKIEPRQILHITPEFDHEVVDGGPAARFCSRLLELMSQAKFLEEYE